MFIKIAWQILASGWVLIGFLWWLYSVLGEHNKKVREKYAKGEQWLHYWIAPFIFIITGPILLQVPGRQQWFLARDGVPAGPQRKTRRLALIAGAKEVWGQHDGEERD